jgi:L-threonate 2-dehydrogenase
MRERLARMRRQEFVRTGIERTAGIIGVGVMGLAMSRNLAASGFKVSGYDPSAMAIANLESVGGHALKSARDVADECPILILSLPSAAALTGCILGDDGIASATAHRNITIECSTLPIETKRIAFDALAQSGKTLLDCPLSGTGAQAIVKDLVVFGSGDRTAFDQCLPVFEGMSRVQRYLGPFGNGSIMKFVANHLVTIHNVAAAEAMVLGIKAGLDPAMLYETLADSAGSSRMLQIRGPLMRDSDYDHPTATILTHIKDLSVISAFATGLNCPLPVYAAAAQLYYAGAAQGRQGQDTAAVCAVLETMAGVQRTAKPA